MVVHQYTNIKKKKEKKENIWLYRKKKQMFKE